MKKLSFYSPIGLQQWDYNTPITSGIGGSEQAHIELSQRLAARGGYQITSYNDLLGPERKDPYGVLWKNKDEFYQDTFVKKDNIYIPDNAAYFIFRDVEIFRKIRKTVYNKIFFIAQDVDYNWGPYQYKQNPMLPGDDIQTHDARQDLSKIDRYICLCKQHAHYTLQKYPELEGRVFISSNGIASDRISQFIEINKDVERNRNQIFYASSPDRGLLLLLENWFRILEFEPEAQLKIAYGFENLDELVHRLQGNTPLVLLKDNIARLINQKGVTFLGRLPQEELWKVWLESNIFFYPSDWPETSCISIMEAQALGAVPVLNKFWAQGENCLSHNNSIYGAYGALLEGPPPQQDSLMKVKLIHSCLKIMRNGVVPGMRQEMQKKALETFNWEKVVDQIEGWL